jgi:hypothetical protein
VSGEWWTKGYPGGPMVAVAGFPRPLYPPDAANQGKAPSPDGPDVVAYKRTVSRVGRWPWSSFDEAYSNGFSHGKTGGNIGDSGIAGIQRQQNMDATGWLGEKTLNTLRSIRIPEGLPHAGEPAMDQTVVKLIADACKLFGGPPEDDEEAVRDSIIEFCEVGLANTAAWDYRQYRAVPPDVNPASPPTATARARCSGHTTTRAGRPASTSPIRRSKVGPGMGTPATTRTITQSSAAPTASATLPTTRARDDHALAHGPHGVALIAGLSFG